VATNGGTGFEQVIGVAKFLAGNGFDEGHGQVAGEGFGSGEAAGFADEQVGSGDLDTMLAVCSRVGALGKILRENPELRSAALPAVRSALAAHDGPDGVTLTAATWVVTARAPAGF